MIHFHYAIQTCDVASFQNLPRYCGSNRTLLTQKSVTSFLNSVQLVAHERKDTMHVVNIIDDRSTDNTQQFLQRAINYYSLDNLNITVEPLTNSGIANSIRACYEWLETNGKDFVYQVQDDYIFRPQTITDITNMWFQVHSETESDAVITPYHDTYVWLQHYRNMSTPRAFMLGKRDFWIQTYDIACTFFTSKRQFSKHWDLYEKFLELIITKSDHLENRSLNYMFTKKGILGLMPITSLALHMQSELEKDPYIDWQSWWDSIEII